MSRRRCGSWPGSPRTLWDALVPLAPLAPLAATTESASLREVAVEEAVDFIIDATPIIQGALLTCLVYAELAGGGPCVDRSEPKISLYHYTALPNLSLILNSGNLRPSTGINAVYGEGQYLTDITPSEASKHRKQDLSEALYADPNHWGPEGVAYLQIEFDADRVKRVNDVYGATFPGKGIFLHGSLLPYSLSGTLVSSGPVEFSAP